MNSYEPPTTHGESKVQGRWLTIGLMVLIAIPLFYVASYYAIVRRNEEGLQYIPMQPDYGGAGRTAAWVFSPIHNLDRRLRPDYWEEWKLQPPLHRKRTAP